MKSVSKCLARKKGCWDPEFEPSIEEIVDYWWDMAIFSVLFLWRARTLEQFPYSVLCRLRSCPGQPARCTPQCATLCNTEHVQFVDVSKVNNGQLTLALAVWDFSWGTRDVVSFSLHPESQSTKNNLANRWGNYDEIMTKIRWRLFQNV